MLTLLWGKMVVTGSIGASTRLRPTSTGAVRKIGQVAGHQRVEPDDLIALGEESVDQARADEAGGSGYQHRSP
jgi:hypothetical protein